MTWNEAVSGLVETSAATGTWLGSDAGKVLADWLVAVGTTGAVLFAVLSTINERKRRMILQEVELDRALDIALDKRSQHADQVSFRVNKIKKTRSLSSRVFRRPSRSRSVVVNNPSIYPIYKVALFHRPPLLNTKEENESALYWCEPLWSVPGVAAGQSESIEFESDSLAGQAELLLRFETQNSTCWAMSEGGSKELISDSSIIGFSAERSIGNLLRSPDAYRQVKRARKAALARQKKAKSSRKQGPPHESSRRGLAQIIGGKQGRSNQGPSQ